MQDNKKLLIGIIFLVALLYSIFTIVSIFSASSNVDVCMIEDSGECLHQQQLNFLNGILPLIISVAVLAGAGIYYFMSGQIEKKQLVVKNNIDILLKFLNVDERKLVNLLIENNGKVLQAELTRLPGMSKVKSHRIVQRLIDRGVIEKETLGKTNIIKFTKEIKEGLN
jgi:hypothetical protein